MRRGLIDGAATVGTSVPAVADRYGLPLREDLDYLLERGGAGLQLRPAEPSITPLRVSFDDPALLRRARQGKQLVLRAVGAKGRDWTVADLTAGLGRDAYVLAARGLRVTMFERSPALAALLADALQRAPVRGLELVHGDALQAEFSADVVYLDPMYPAGTKSALNKRDLRILRDLAGDDDDAEALLHKALACAARRVVVKRPKLAPPIAGPSPSASIRGKAVRWDIYPR